MILILASADINITDNDKVYVFRNESKIWVLEDGEIPYETGINDIFIPQPNSTVLNAFVSNSNILLVTDHFTWTYQRFKLRDVVFHNTANKIKPFIMLSIFIFLLK